MQMDGRTDRRTYIMKLTDVFRHFANVYIKCKEFFILSITNRLYILHSVFLQYFPHVPHAKTTRNCWEQNAMPLDLPNVDLVSSAYPLPLLCLRIALLHSIV
jgi:hypothetical protein